MINPDKPPPALIICAFNARPLAQAAQKNGHAVWALDGFADRDLRSCAEKWHRTTFPPQDLIEVLERWDPHAHMPLLYGSGVESMIDTLADIGRHREIIGNDIATLRRLHDPRQFFASMKQCGLETPPVLFSPPAKIPENIKEHSPSNPPEKNPEKTKARPTTAWLCKNTSLAGGQGIRFFDATSSSSSSSSSPSPSPSSSPSPSKTEYYQQYKAGKSGSVLFLADGHHALPIILSTSWHDSGHDKGHDSGHDSGAMRYGYDSGLMRYGGACRWTLNPQSDPYWRDVVQAVTKTFALRGLNSLDFIETPQGHHWFLEINPRIGASFHLLSGRERQDMITQHQQSSRGTIGSFSIHYQKSRAHAIIYADTALRIPDIAWPIWSSDIPMTGTQITSGMPICSVEAISATPDQARQFVLARKHSLLSTLYGTNKRRGDHHEKSRIAQNPPS